MQKQVLIIEDEPDFIMDYKRRFKELNIPIEIVSQLPLNPEDSEFQVLLARISEFAIVVWDACMRMPTGTIDTYEGYIQAAAKVFKGPMIANSSGDAGRKLQMGAGCTHMVFPNKGDMPELVEKLLNQ